MEHDLDEIVDGDLADDLLGLIFMACHPILSPDARSALTLKLVCGLTPRTSPGRSWHPDRRSPSASCGPSARSPAANVRFELPGPSRAAGAPRRRPRGHLPGLQRGLLGDQRRPVDPRRPVRGGAPARSDAGRLTPHDTETLGLLALIELQASRLRARTGPDGEPVLLLDQDRTRWDRLLIQRGLANIDRIEQLGGTVGPYALQAAIAACHARATRCRGHRLGTDHRAVRRPGPDQPVAGRRAQPRRGDRAGVRPAGGARRSCCRCSTSPSMRDYHLLPAVAGDLLCRAGEHERAREHFLRAASMTSNAVERTTMQRRAAECAAQHGGESSV